MNKLSPFKYSHDNKRYHTFNHYLKSNYGQKVFKIPVDAGFTCPNRDGTVDHTGCSFCSARGSGDMIIRGTLEKQIEEGFKMMRRKWPSGLAMLYFQAYTNTHDTLDNLKLLYDPYFEDDRFVSISIATRADCLDDEKIAYFKEKSKQKDLWLEIGLQSIHESTNEYIHRAHDTSIVFDVIKKCQDANIKVCIHIINGLPYETKEMMLETAQALAKVRVDAIKIHMFHVLKHTMEAYRYKHNPYPLLSMEEFADIVIQQLEILPPKTIIERLSGDGLEKDLIAPMWTLKKINLLNHIDKEMVRKDTYQGINYES